MHASPPGSDVSGPSDPDPSAAVFSVNENDPRLHEINWYAVHTKSRHEKLVSTLIKKQNIEFYLPVRKTIRKWSDRKKIVEFPLFNGYLFVHIPLEDKTKILHTKGVVKLLGGYAPEPIPEDQIETLKKFEQHDMEVDPYLHLHEGQTIRVTKGPLKDCRGILVRKKNKYRLVLNLEIIQQSVSVELDSSDVEGIY